MLLVGVDVAGRPDELLGAAAILLAALGYAAGPMLLNRRFADLDPRVSMGSSLLVAALMLTPFAAVSIPDEMPSGDALIALGVLGLLCTAAAFVFFGMLIAEVGPGARRSSPTSRRSSRSRSGSRCSTSRWAPARSRAYC